MISCFIGGKPNESTYSAFPESEKGTATQCEPGIYLSKLIIIFDGFTTVDGKISNGYIP
jgi:hypothetical protein